jgi:hypothetical protein
MPHGPTRVTFTVNLAPQAARDAIGSIGAALAERNEGSNEPSVKLWDALGFCELECGCGDCRKSRPPVDSK